MAQELEKTTGAYKMVYFFFIKQHDHFKLL